MRYEQFSKIDLQNGGFFSVKNIFIKKVTKTNRLILKLFECYYLVLNFDFLINWCLEMPRISLSKTSKKSLPAFTLSIFGKTRGHWEKWLWYLDSAPINYPGTDTLVPAIELAEICEPLSKKAMTSFLIYRVTSKTTQWVLFEFSM